MIWVYTLKSNHQIDKASKTVPSVLPPNLQSVKILGDKLVELELTRSTVSEVLRIFLESHGYDTELCDTLRTKPFHALPPDTKAAILGFIVDELNGSNVVTRL